jgi:aminopeptidase-like protein
MVDGAAILRFIEEIFPICRSITGDGVRRTLAAIGRVLEPCGDLALSEVESGTPVLDWHVPPEWNVRDAYIADVHGRRVVDFGVSNLHLVSYSVPVHEWLSLEALRAHLHTLPEHPEWIPYRTSYYEKSWGFCLSQQQLDGLAEGEYEVMVDSSLEPGHLTYGEFVLPGDSADEVLISTHVCHPSLADDNLSGVAVSVFLAQELARRANRRYTYRFLYAPGTIGAITWLERNRPRASRIRHGLTLTCLGDNHPFTYKRTVGGSAEVDRAATHVLRHADGAHQTIDFFPYGYDERQYNSPGFRLPVGSLMRGRHGQFPEYHTSADNLGFISAERLAESLNILTGIAEALEGNRRYRNLAPFGEPQLGRRGLYRAVGGTDVPNLQLAMLWVLSLSDDAHDLLEIADRAGLPFPSIRSAATLLEQHGLLECVDR